MEEDDSWDSSSEVNYEDKEVLFFFCFFFFLAFSDDFF